MLSLLGGAAGLYLSFFLMDAIATIKVPVITPVMINARLGVRVLVFALCMSLLAGIPTGMVPAIQSTRPRISTTLEEEHVGRTRGAARARGSLIVAQVALTALLAAAAVGFGRSLVSGYRLDPGFGKHPAAIAYLAPGPSRSEDERRAFYDAYLGRVTDIPGVVSAGMTTHMPLQISPTYRLALKMPGVDPPPGQDAHSVDWAAVGGHYFEAMGIPLLAGRFFDSGYTHCKKGGGHRPPRPILQHGSRCIEPATATVRHERRRADGSGVRQVDCRSTLRVDPESADA